jgi:hypothetical protein
MHATDSLHRSLPDTAGISEPAALPPSELSPEQLAALAQSFRAAVHSNPDSPMRASTPSSQPPLAPGVGAVSPDSVVSVSPEFLPAVFRSSTSHLAQPLAGNPPPGETPAFPSLISTAARQPSSPETRIDSLIPLSDPDETPSLGTTVLESMQQQSRQAAAVPVESSPIMTATPAARIEKIEQIVAETVSRVLVSDPLHDGRREVRVSLQPDLLPQTDIRLWRDAGRLHVEFISTPATLEQSRLADHLPRLAEAIHQRQPYGEIPAVSISLRSADTNGQPGDGRSRQQYQPLFEDDAQA